MSRAEAVKGACSHHRQKWGAGLLPCATPGCPDGRRGNVLVVHGFPEAPPKTLGALKPDLEDAVVEELTMRRTQPAELFGAWEWRVKG